MTSPKHWHIIKRCSKSNTYYKIVSMYLLADSVFFMQTLLLSERYSIHLLRHQCTSLVHINHEQLRVFRQLINITLHVCGSNLFITKQTDYIKIDCNSDFIYELHIHGNIPVFIQWSSCQSAIAASILVHHVNFIVHEMSISGHAQNTYFHGQTESKKRAIPTRAIPRHAIIFHDPCEQNSSALQKDDVNIVVAVINEQVLLSVLRFLCIRPTNVHV
jgi:hypothetical protein